MSIRWNVARSCLSGAFLGTAALLLGSGDLAAMPASLETSVRKPQQDSNAHRKGTKSSETDQVLVVLVEFGSDTITYTPGESTWDPIGHVDATESTGSVGDCSRINTEHAISTATPFTYTGPLHNEIPPPPAPTTFPDGAIYTADFSPEWYQGLLFGDGVTMDYSYADATSFHEEFAGVSLRAYFQDMSLGQLDVQGDVVGWLSVPHSLFWYGADPCPGGLSGAGYRSNVGAIPGGGTAASLVSDIVAEINEHNPGFNWQKYDADGDGAIDHLVIIHAGLGEEESEYVALTDLGEGTLWTQSGSVNVVADTTNSISVRGYWLLPENVGLGVLAYDYALSQGADPRYDYNASDTNTAAGFWTVMADSSSGYPRGMIPSALDPLQLEDFGWLEPMAIDGTSSNQLVRLGQNSAFPGGEGVQRAVKILLPDGQQPAPVAPFAGEHQWWGGKTDQLNAMMTLNTAVAIPAGGTPRLVAELSYGIETEWDFLWVQASDDGGVTWDTLTNANTTCTHDPGWIGEMNGFPADLCAASMGGFTDYSPAFPDFSREEFDLSAYVGSSILVRFWYMTDWGTTYEGAYVDDVSIVDGTTVLFSDGAESGDANWTYSDGWQRISSTLPFPQAYYLEWRNTGPDGGFDRGLGDERFRYGPAQGGLLVWYNNGMFRDNSISQYMDEYPSFGPKGVMLPVDAHPEPYRDPDQVAAGYANEAANIRGQMRDACFNVFPTPDFTYKGKEYEGRPAVDLFSDALSYYPGAEYASRGPGYEPPSYKWVTVQWDSSVVVPAKAAYAMKAPGYDPTLGTSDSEMRYHCSAAAAGKLSCYFFGVNTGIRMAGNATGNPADAPGGPTQYGWNFRVLEQDGQTGTIAIWNGPLGFIPVDEQSYVGDTVSVQLRAELTTGGTVSFSATNLPGGLSLDASSGVVSGTVAAGSQGEYEVSVTVTESVASATDSRTFTWTVPNRPPVSALMGDQVVACGEIVSLLVATDPDDDELLFSSDDLPSGLSLHADTGVIHGTVSCPLPTQSTVEVSDGIDSATIDIAWVTFPQLGSPSALPTCVNDAVEVSVLLDNTATGLALTFSASGLPSGVSIDAATGVISGTLSADSAGAYDVTVSITDGSHTAAVSFTWTVGGCGDTGDKGDSARDKDKGGCSCNAASPAPGGLALALGVLLCALRRRRVF